MSSKLLETMSDRNITKLSLKRLQTLMDDAGYTEDEQEQVRARRRKLQNRVSAKASAARKHKQFAAVLEKNEILQAQLDEARNQNAILEAKLMEAEKVHALAAEVAQKNVSCQQEIARLNVLLCARSDESSIPAGCSDTTHKAAAMIPSTSSFGLNNTIFTCPVSGSDFNTQMDSTDHTVPILAGDYGELTNGSPLQEIWELC